MAINLHDSYIGLACYIYLTYIFKGGKANAARPDPVREECDIPVKIADLGNACWTVGLNSSCIISFVNCKID